MAGDAFEYDEEAIAKFRSGEVDEESTEDQDQTSKDQETEEDYSYSSEEEEGDEEDGLSEVERQAMEQGWRPKDEWDGDPDSWVDAKEFVYRGQLMDRISKQNKALQTQAHESARLKKALKKLTEHQKKIAQNEYQKALRDLKKEKLEALEADDHEAVMEIDERMTDLEKNQEDYTSEYDLDLEDESGTEDTEDEHPQFTQEQINTVKEWVDNNPWYTQNQAMKGAADALGNAYLEQNPGDIDGMVQYINRGIRKEFPHKFKSVPTKKGAVTENGRRSPKGKVKGKKTYGVNDLSDEQRRVAKEFVDLGVYKNVQDYVNELAELKELPSQQGE